MPDNSHTKQGDSIERTLGRIEANLESIRCEVHNNRNENIEQHKEIMAGQKEFHDKVENKLESLTKHVNHEVELLSCKVNDMNINGTDFLSRTVTELAKNLQNEDMEARSERKALKADVRLLQEKNKARESERKGQKKVWQYATAILAITLTIVSLISGIGHLLGWF